MSSVVVVVVVRTSGRENLMCALLSELCLLLRPKQILTRSCSLFIRQLKFKQITGTDFGPPKKETPKQVEQAEASEKNKAKNEAKAAAKAEKEAKKIAQRLERERREQEKAAKMAGVGMDNFGDAPMVQSQQVTDKVWTPIANLTPKLADQTVLVLINPLTVRHRKWWRFKSRNSSPSAKQRLHYPFRWKMLAVQNLGKKLMLVPTMKMMWFQRMKTGSFASAKRCVSTIVGSICVPPPTNPSFVLKAWSVVCFVNA